MCAGGLCGPSCCHPQPGAVSGAGPAPRAGPAGPPGGSGHQDFPFLTIIGKAQHGPAQPEHFIWYGAHGATASAQQRWLLQLCGNIWAAPPHSSARVCATTARENRAQTLACSQQTPAEPLGVEEGNCWAGFSLTWDVRTELCCSWQKEF